MVQKELRLLIGKNEPQKAIEILLSLPEVVNDNDELFDEIILISSRYQGYLTAKRAGTLTFDQEQIQTSRINDSLLKAIQRIPNLAEKNNSNKPLRKEDRIIELLINQDFYDFDSSKKENLVGVISGLLNIQRQEIIIRRVSNGSVKVTIEMPEEKAKQLINLLKFGTSVTILTKTLKINSITLKGWGSTFFISTPFIISIIGSFIIFVCIFIYAVFAPQNTNKLTQTNPIAVVPRDSIVPDTIHREENAIAIVNTNKVRNINSSTPIPERKISNELIQSEENYLWRIVNDSLWPLQGVHVSTYYSQEILHKEFTTDSLGRFWFDNSSVIDLDSFYMILEKENYDLKKVLFAPFSKNGYQIKLSKTKILKND
jgi:hypothetical protein